jgi:integrase
MSLTLVPPRKGNPNWQIRGSYLHVKRLYRSAGTPDERLAKKLLRKMERDIESGAFIQDDPKTFSTAALSYLRAGGERRFIKPLSIHFGDTPLNKIDQDAIDKAADAIYPDADQATRNRQVYTPISAILKHAGIDKPLKRPKGARGKLRLHWLQVEQLHPLFSAAHALNPRFGALCVFLFYTGCRLSEALGLRWEQVQLPNNFAYIGHTKPGVPRPVYLPTSVVAVLASLSGPAEGRVFGYSKCGRIYNLLDEAARRAGVTIPDGIAFHIFRHSYAALMRRKAGLDTSGLVATGAWKSADAARVYEHVEFSEEAMKAEMLDAWKCA